MKIYVLVKTNAKNDELKQIDDEHFEARIKEPAKEGRANKALIKRISDYLKIPQSRIKIIRGLKSKAKTIEID